jgi:hypothetical protein
MYSVRQYDRAHAVEYARRWALSRNPLFGVFEGIGGDCTNFISQCVLAGCCTMDYAPTFGWYYKSMSDRAPAWTGVVYLYNYLTGSGGHSGRGTHPGPFGEQVDIGRAEAGDIIQLADRDGKFYHSLLITGFTKDDILVSTHTYDALDRGLSTYVFASLRVIHILGYRRRAGGGRCFAALIEGRSLRGV